MKLFVGLSAAVSLTVLLAACSSSSPPSDDAGASDGAADGTTDGAGACTPVAPATVPTFTAPALGQGVCGSSDIAAFAAACGSGATPSCQAWLQTSSTAACRGCLLGTNNTIGPFDSVTIDGQSTIIPSLAACILGVAGSTTPAACPAAAEPLVYCADVACASCTGAAQESCVKSTTSGVCAQYVTPLTSGCGAVIGMLAGCETSIGTAAELTEAATVICGSAEGGSGDGGTGEGGASDGGASDGGSTDGATDSGSEDAGGASDSGAADSSATDSGVADAGATDAADSGG